MVEGIPEAIKAAYCMGGRDGLTDALSIAAYAPDKLYLEGTTQEYQKGFNEGRQFIERRLREELEKRSKEDAR